MNTAYAGISLSPQNMSDAGKHYLESWLDHRAATAASEVHEILLNPDLGTYQVRHATDPLWRHIYIVRQVIHKTADEAFALASTLQAVSGALEITKERLVQILIGLNRLIDQAAEERAIETGTAVHSWRLEGIKNLQIGHIEKKYQHAVLASRMQASEHAWTAASSDSKAKRQIGQGRPDRKPPENAGSNDGRPRLPPASLKRWWAKIESVAGSITQEELLAMCRSLHPHYTVSRERIRELTGSRKRGRKPIRGKIPTIKPRK